MPRHVWSKLNTQQIGAYCEYFVKMELTMHGYEVYTTEVDDRGVDFVARRGQSAFIEVQVKSRTPGKAGGLILLAPQRGKIMESPKGDLTPAA